MDSSFTFRLLLTFLAVACCCWATSIGRSSSRSKRSVIEVDNPEETLRVLGSLAQRIIDAETISNDKRGLDLGLSRGFSGSQAAKHLMGLSAASFANGPGRRRREAQN